MKRIKKIVCPYCGSVAVLRDGKYVYGDRAKGEKLYVCSNYPNCDAYVGVHKGTSIPLGTLANSELRNKRIRAHKLFDSIWKNKLMSKKRSVSLDGILYGNFRKRCSYCQIFRLPLRRIDEKM